MGSAYKRYRKDSPEAVASVLAALLVSDGRIDAREIDLMDRLGAFAIVGIERETFLRVAGEMFVALRLRGGAAIESGFSRSARLDAALDAIESRERQLLVAAVLVYLADADRVVDEDEIALVRHVFRRWDITPALLQRELSVPGHRMRPFADAPQPAGA